MTGNRKNKADDQMVKATRRFKNDTGFEKGDWGRADTKYAPGPTYEAEGPYKHKIVFKHGDGDLAYMSTHPKETHARKEAIAWYKNTFLTDRRPKVKYVIPVQEQVSKMDNSLLKGVLTEAAEFCEAAAPAVAPSSTKEKHLYAAQKHEQAAKHAKSEGAMIDRPYKDAFHASSATRHQGIDKHIRANASHYNYDWIPHFGGRHEFHTKLAQMHRDAANEVKESTNVEPKAIGYFIQHHLPSGKKHRGVMMDTHLRELGVNGRLSTGERVTKDHILKHWNSSQPDTYKYEWDKNQLPEAVSITKCDICGGNHPAAKHVGSPEGKKAINKFEDQLSEEVIVEAAFPEVLKKHGYNHVESGKWDRYEHPDSSHVNVWPSGTWEHKGVDKSKIAKSGGDPEDLDKHLGSLTEMAKDAVCECGHSFHEHASGKGCKACHHEGLVSKANAEHKFKLNQRSVKMEGRDERLAGFHKWADERQDRRDAVRQKQAAVLDKPVKCDACGKDHARNVPCPKKKVLDELGEDEEARTATCVKCKKGFSYQPKSKVDMRNLCDHCMAKIKPPKEGGPSGVTTEAMKYFRSHDDDAAAEAHLKSLEKQGLKAWKKNSPDGKVHTFWMQEAAKKKGYDVNADVRAIARERVGQPKPKQVIKSKKDRKPKYKEKFDQD